MVGSIKSVYMSRPLGMQSDYILTIHPPRGCGELRVESTLFPWGGERACFWHFCWILLKNNTFKIFFVPLHDISVRNDCI